MSLQPSMPVLFAGHGSPMNAIEDNVHPRLANCRGIDAETEGDPVHFSALGDTRSACVSP